MRRQIMRARLWESIYKGCVDVWKRVPSIPCLPLHYSVPTNHFIPCLLGLARVVA
jgi:hypothetical protein